jgi:N-acetylmuramoyl-L-alanine amidase
MEWSGNLVMKICIDAGHGGQDSGATFNNVNESDVVLSIALHLKNLLLDEGHELLMTRETNSYVTLKDRVAVANDGNSDIFISIHTNADLDDDSDSELEGKGEEIWIHQNSKNGRFLAEVLKESIDDIFPNSKFRGIKETKKLYVLKHTNMPAILIELGFIDNICENEFLSNPENHLEIAESIATSICEYA